MQDGQGPKKRKERVDRWQEKIDSLQAHRGLLLDSLTAARDDRDAKYDFAYDYAERILPRAIEVELGPNPTKEQVSALRMELVRRGLEKYREQVWNMNYRYQKMYDELNRAKEGKAFSEVVNMSGKLLDFGVDQFLGPAKSVRSLGQKGVDLGRTVGTGIVEGASSLKDMLSAVGSEIGRIRPGEGVNPPLASRADRFSGGL